MMMKVVVGALCRNTIQLVCIMIRVS